MTIGQKIKKLRTDAGITQIELAKRIGVSFNTVYVWERDAFEPSIFNCIVLADYFGITLDELCRSYSEKEENNG